MRLAGWTAVAVAAATGAMAQQSFVLDPILVSAARDARPLLDTPVAATVLEGEALAVKQATDFQELIGDVPGVTIEGGPRSMAQEPNIRGFQNDQIEGELDYDAGLWFGGLALTIPRGEADGGSTLGSIPQDRLSATFGFGPGAPWELGLAATYAAERGVPEGSPAADAWTTVDPFGSWAPSAPQFQGAVLRAGIDNIFDEEYAIYPNGLNQPGRTHKISAAVTF